MGGPLPWRLDDDAVLYSVLETVHFEGFDRPSIEQALIKQAPVDLDLLGVCYERLLAVLTAATSSEATTVPAASDQRAA